MEREHRLAWLLIPLTLAVVYALAQWLAPARSAAAPPVSRPAPAAVFRPTLNTAASGAPTGRHPDPQWRGQFGLAS